MSLFGKRAADPIQGAPAQKPSPFATQTNQLLGNNNPSNQSSTPSIFGSSNPQQNQPTPSIFGASNTQQNQPTPSIFGSSTTSQNQPTPSIFGNISSTTSQPNQSGSIFGATSTTSQPNQSNNIFASTNINPTNTSLFGSQANNPSQSNPTNNLFASNNSNPVNNNSNPSNLFGNSTENKPSSLFGNQPINNLFGNTSNNTNSNPSSSTLFGSSATNSQTNQTNLLGTPQNQNTNNTSSLNLFGSSNSKPIGSLFNTQLTPTNNQPTSTFGNQTISTPISNNSLFNSTSNQSVFNRSAPPSVSANTPVNGLSSLRSSTAQLYKRPITLSELSIQDRIIKICAGWNVNDPQCQFQYFFYNVVPPEQVHLYGKPNQIAADDPRWQRAKRNNPDPSRLVPTLAVGFEDLTKRVAVQQKQAQIHVMKLEEISNRLNEITRKHNLETSSRLHKLKTEQVKLSTRLMGLVNKLNGIVLHAASSSGTVGSVTQPTYHQQQLLMTTRNSLKEDELFERVKHLKADLERFGGKSKISELWSTLNQIKNFGGFFIPATANNSNGAHPHHSQVGHHPSTNHNHSNLNNHHHYHNGATGNSATFVGLSFIDGGAGKWSVTDEKEIKKVLEILVKQQKGIDHLVLLLRRSRADLMLMRQAFNLESNLKSIEW